MEKFLEESKNLAKFRGTVGIVQIFDSFQENETVYIVMEYLDGETLEERLKRQNKLSEREALDIMIPVLQGLTLVHKEGILHRDIAPNNIFLCNTGEVKLLDFGAARSVTGSHSKSLTVLYKEGYTAEEQYRSRGDQGPWTDVYSCAATLYRMITGVVPQGAMERRLKDELKRPSKFGVKTSKNVENAILNALNVEVKHRTKHAEQFMQELTGEVSSKKHFIRTMEKSVESLPSGVRAGMIVFIVVAMLFVGLLSSGRFDVIAPSFSQIGVPEGKVRVPNLVNMDTQEAQQKTEELGLSFMIQKKAFSTEVPENYVLSQTFSAGTLVDEGEPLGVIISAGLNSMTAQELKEDGIEVVEIPDLQYQDRDEARMMLSDAGLDVKISYEKSGIVEGGKVISQSVAVGEKVLKGQEITLIVEDFLIDFGGDEELETNVKEAINMYVQLEEVYASDLMKVRGLRVYGGGSGYVLKNCLNLRTLRLYRNGREVSGDFDELEFLTKMETLSIDGFDINNFVWLERMDKLNTMELSNCYIDNLSGLNEKDNLTSLEFNNCEIRDLSVDDELENLAEVTMDIQTEVANVGNEKIFKNVWMLSLNAEIMKKIYGFDNMSRLKKLDVHGVMKQDIANIEQLPELEVLELNGSFFMGKTDIVVQDLLNTNDINILRINGKDYSTSLKKLKEKNKTGENG